MSELLRQCEKLISVCDRRRDALNSICLLGEVERFKLAVARERAKQQSLVIDPHVPSGAGCEVAEYDAFTCPFCGGDGAYISGFAGEPMKTPAICSCCGGTGRIYRRRIEPTTTSDKGTGYLGEESTGACSIPESEDSPTEVVAPTASEKSLLRERGKTIEQLGKKLAAKNIEVAELRRRWISACETNAISALSHESRIAGLESRLSALEPSSSPVETWEGVVRGGGTFGNLPEHVVDVSKHWPVGTRVRIQVMESEVGA